MVNVFFFSMLSFCDYFWNKPVNLIPKTFFVSSFNDCVYKMQCSLVVVIITISPIDGFHSLCIERVVGIAYDMFFFSKEDNNSFALLLCHSYKQICYDALHTQPDEICDSTSFSFCWKSSFFVYMFSSFMFHVYWICWTLVFRHQNCSQCIGIGSCTSISRNIGTTLF